MRIRILILITDLQIGGTPLAVKRLACGLDRDKFDVHVASLAPVGPVAQELRQNAIPTYALGARGIWDLQVLLRLAALIIKLRPQILHCFLVHANFIGRIVGNLLQVPCIIASIRTAEQGKNWHLILENLTCRLSRLTLCNSRSVYQHVLRCSHVPASHLRVIPNGVDYDSFAGANQLQLKDLWLNPGRQTFIFVGRLDPVKSLDTLLFALSKLSPDQKWQLLIVGDGPERPRLEDLADKLSIRERVIFLGFRRDIERLLKTADIYVQPSLWEGCSMSVLEAMAAGLPIIASRTVGLVDLVEDGKTGLLAGPSDVNSWSKMLSILLNDSLLAQKLAQAGQKVACQSHSFNQMVRQYENLYLHLTRPYFILAEQNILTRASLILRKRKDFNLDHLK